MDRELRRNQNTMIIIGLGVIAFAVWSVIKAVLYGFSADRQENEESVSWLLWILVIGILAFDFLMRFHVGRSAIAEARGQGKRKYLGWVILMMVCSATVISMTVYTMIVYSDELGGSTLSALASLIVELTSLYVLIQLLISRHRVNVLKKEIAARGQAEAPADVRTFQDPWQAMQDPWQAMQDTGKTPELAPAEGR